MEKCVIMNKNFVKGGEHAMTKTVDKRPKIQPSKAIVGRLNVGGLMAIDPSATPVKAYTKRTK